MSRCSQVCGFCLLALLNTPNFQLCCVHTESSVCVLHKGSPARDFSSCFKWIMHIFIPTKFCFGTEQGARFVFGCIVQCWYQRAPSWGKVEIPGCIFVPAPQQLMHSSETALQVWLAWNTGIKMLKHKINVRSVWEFCSKFTSKAPCHHGKPCNSLICSWKYLWFSVGLSGITQITLWSTSLTSKANLEQAQASLKVSCCCFTRPGVFLLSWAAPLGLTKPVIIKI